MEVLTEDYPVPDDDLMYIAHEIVYGDSSGAVKETVREIVSAKDMAGYLMAQGSDPEFFGLNENGDDMYEN